MDSPEIRKNGNWEHLSTKNVARPNPGVKRLRQKKTAWATPWPKPPAVCHCFEMKKKKKEKKDIQLRLENSKLKNKDRIVHTNSN